MRRRSSAATRATVLQAPARPRRRGARAAEDRRRRLTPVPRAPGPFSPAAGVAMNHRSSPSATFGRGRRALLAAALALTAGAALAQAVPEQADQDRRALPARRPDRYRGAHHRPAAWANCSRQTVLIDNRGGASGIDRRRGLHPAARRRLHADDAGDADAARAAALQGPRLRRAARLHAGRLGLRRAAGDGDQSEAAARRRRPAAARRQGQGGRRPA